MSAKEQRLMAEAGRAKEEEERLKKEDAEARIAAQNGAKAVPNAKLFNYLMSIARTEAERICANLSTTLTPEKAVAAFRRVGPEVDALLMGSVVDVDAPHSQETAGEERVLNDAGRKHTIQGSEGDSDAAKRARSENSSRQDHAPDTP